MLLKYLNIALKKKKSPALLILMQNTEEGEFKRNGLNNKCPQLEKNMYEKREGGLHQQIWDKQVGRGAWQRLQILTSHPVFLQAMWAIGKQRTQHSTCTAEAPPN